MASSYEIATAELATDAAPGHRARYALGLETARDHPDSRDLAINGSLPDWLSGVLVRTAPARFDVGRTVLTQWFDGHAMLHRFDIDRGRVGYRSRYLESESAMEASKSGDPVCGEYGTNPPRTTFERITAIAHQPKLTDNCNVQRHPTCG